MPPFLYRCPNTGDNVQAWAADDPTDESLTYLEVTCLACAQAHLVNPKTGKVLGLNWMRGVLRVYTTRTEVIRSRWPFSVIF